MIGFRKNRQPKKITWKSLIVLFIVFAVFGVLKAKEMFFSGVEVPTADVPSVSYDDIVDGDEGEGGVDSEEGGVLNPAFPSEDEPEPENELPITFNLAVPFSSQAPYKVWDAFHEETCEEASFLMAMEFFNGNTLTDVDPAAADKVYAEMVALEERLGMGVSIDASQAVKFIDEYTDDFTARIIENPTADDIKKLIASGMPVIVPAAGRELGNPFFTGEGPLYHMLIIRGYTEDTFITNDPGTQHGKNYVYSIPVLMSAMGDWNNGNPPEGASRVIVIEPATKP